MKTGKEKKYPSGIGGVYLSAILATLSVILAVLILQSNLPNLISYVFSTAAMTVFIFVLKIRLTTSTVTKSSKAGSLQNGEQTTSLKTLVAVFCILLASFFVPLSLSWVLPADAWFILVISFTSSISFAELLFYLYMRRNDS